MKKLLTFSTLSALSGLASLLPATALAQSVPFPSTGIQGSKSGNTSVIGTVSGALTNGHCVSIDASGNLIDAGAACGTGSGSGTVNAATAGQIPYYATSTAAVSGNANLTISNGAVTLGQTGSVIGKLLLSGNTSGLVTIAPQAAAGTYNFNLPTTAGASGGPLLSGGGGAAAMTWGTPSGSTTVFGTTTGAFVGGNCVKTDGNGNLQDAGAGCGVVASGTAGGDLSGTYPNPTVASAGGRALNLGGAVTTGGALTLSGAFTFSGTLTGNTTLTFPTSGTLLAGTASGTTTKFATVTGATPGGNCVTFDGSGNLIDAGAPCSAGGGGSGTVSNAGINSIAVYPANGTTVAGLAPSNNAVLLTTAGGVPVYGTKSGNTTVVGTTTGALTNGHCVSIDASGNLQDAGAACGTGAGTVTSASVVSAHGFAGTVATATTTPAITLSTSVNGIVQGDGTSLSAASTTGSGNVVLATSPSIASPTLTGTVAGANTIPLSILAQSATNTMLGNWTSGTANVLANTMPSCSDSGGNHLNYVNGTGVTCGTSAGSGGFNLISTITPSLQATVTASQATTVLTVSAVTSGVLAVGQVVVTGGVSESILSLGTGSGGIGTYNVDVSQTVSSASMTSYTNPVWTSLGATYNNYQVICAGLSTSGSDTLGIQFGTGAIPTWDTSGYTNEASTVRNGTIANFTGATSYAYAFPQIGTATSISVNAILTNVPSTGSLVTTVLGTAAGNQGGTFKGSYILSGADTSTTAKTAIKVAAINGGPGIDPFTNGYCSLYGMAK